MTIPDVFGIQEVAIAGAVALVIGLGGGAYAAHLFYAPRIELAAEKLTQANGRITILGQNIKDQNDALDKLQLAAADRAKQADAALKKAQAQRAQAEKSAADVMAAQPAPGEDRCTAASALIRKELAQ